MEILKSQGKFEILSNTDNVIEFIAKIARVCYQSQDKSNPESDFKLVKNKIMELGHFPMIEFVDVVVQFSDISIGFTRESNRHRMTSVAESSTRYVKNTNLNVIVPPNKNENMNVMYDEKSNNQYSFASFMELTEKMYKGLEENGWLNEDARQCLPIGTKTQAVVKANLREWIHIFKMRCDITAHWEIREVMLKLLYEFKKRIPIIFDDFRFFKSGNGKEFARMVMNKTNLKKEIEFYLLSGGKLEDIPTSYFGNNTLI
jgi:thymidylate synthase (FAD)